MSGAFITFEGGEGSGKTTQLKLLAEAFADAGISHVLTREPGGTPAAEKIRALLVEGDQQFSPTSETLLFYAARVEHVHKLINPALKIGKTVLCDRFADSTLVYQGVGKGMSSDFIHRLHHLTLRNFEPMLTIILDIDPAVGLKRARERKNAETRFENLSLDFHQAVREGFLAIAKNDPKRCAVLDAAQDIATLHSQIIALIKERLEIALHA